jgi:signal peptidase
MSQNPPKNEDKKKKTWKIQTKKKVIEIPIKDVIEIGIFIVVLFTLTFGTFWILQASLKTKTPMVVVSSGSMTGTYNEGDLLFIKGGTDPADLEVGDHVLKTGDVIVFEAVWSDSGDPIVHRIVNSRYNATGEEIWEFETWGDANDHSDQYYGHPWVRQDEIVGKVVGRIPWIGWVKLFLARTGLTIYIIIGLILVLTISIVWDLTHPEKEEEKKNRKKNLSRTKDENEENNESVNLGI